MTGLQRHLLFLIVSVNVAVNFGDMPKWIPTLGLLFVCWRWLADIYRIPCPGRWTAAFLALLASFGIWAEFGKIIGDPASTSLLIIMVSLKVFEIKGYRDLMVVTYLCFLLLMAKLLSAQSVANSVFLIGDSIAILSLMYLYHFPAKQRGIPWKPAAKLILVSFPLIAILFLLFPRFNFSLFKRDQDVNSKVGFSGQLRPGVVSKLAKSNQIAFRAFFKNGFRPPLSRLYWRGAVLEQTSGLNWDPSPNRKRFKSRDVAENLVEVVIEDGGSNWIFTIDYPHHVVMNQVNRQNAIEEGSGFTYFLAVPMSNRETYQFSFALDSRQAKWDPSEIETARLNSKEVISPRLKALVKTWKAAIGKPDEALRLIREFYLDQQFTYTLTPPTIENIDDFLFKAKKGFCEHYSAATAQMLQLLNIPARVVVGYQGASPSLAGDYLIVYQRDAHAWLEFWDESKKSWQRLDPTAWVAMDRLTMGSEEYYRRQSASALSEYYNNPIAKLFGIDGMRWLSRASLLLDQAEVIWMNLLLRYDFNLQKELLEKLGMFKITRIGLAFGLLALLLVLGFLTATIMKWRKQAVSEPSLKLYNVLLRRLKAAGLKWSDSSGPLTLLELSKSKFPNEQPTLERLFEYVIQLRYGKTTYDVKRAGEFRRAVRLMNLNTTAQQD